MGLLDDFITGYQGASSKASESLGEYFDTYQDWAKKNRELVPEGINKFGDWVTEQMKTPGADVLMPMPAVGALWKNTAPMLEQMSPIRYKMMAPQDLKVLESLTETYPSVRNTILKPSYTNAFVSPKNPAPDVATYLKGETPGTIELFRPETYPINRSPAMSYAHEGSHAFSGGSMEHKLWAGMPDTVYTRPAIEGYAEGMSNALLNQYNQNAASSYWKQFKNTGQSELYTKAGQHGVDIGSMIRSGSNVNQQDALEYLSNLIKNYYQ